MNDKKNAHRKKNLHLPLGIFHSIAVGTLVCVFSAFLLLLIGCAYCHTQDHPAALYLPVAWISLYVAALIGGWITVHLNGSTVLSGFGCGVAFFLLLILLSLCLRTVPSVSVSAAVTACLQAAVIPASGIGALLRIRHSAKKRRPTRRRR